jgi:hypothetical protein
MEELAFVCGELGITHPTLGSELVGVFVEVSGVRY